MKGYTLILLILLGCFALPITAQEDMSQPLVWEKVLEWESGDYLDEIVTYGTDAWVICKNSGVVFHSSDGMNWEQLNLANDDGAIKHILSLVVDDDGLLIGGFYYDEASQVWQLFVSSSPDGQTWTEQLLDYTVPQTENPWLLPRFQMELARGPLGAIVAVAYETRIDWDAFSQELYDHTPIEFDASNWPLEYNIIGNNAQGLLQILNGNLIVFEDSFENLGVDARAVEAYRVGSGDVDLMSFKPVRMWQSDDGLSWNELEDHPFKRTVPEIVLATDEQWYFSTSSNWDEVGMLRSLDNEGTWTKHNQAAISVSSMMSWQDQLWAVEWSDTGPKLHTSADGDTWQPMQSETFDKLSFYNLDIGNYGFLGQGYDDPMSVWYSSPGTPTTILLKKDGMLMELRYGFEGFTITDLESGEVIVTSNVKGQESFGNLLAGIYPPEAMSVDIDTRIITIHDPATDEVLMTITFDELEEAYLAAAEEAGMQTSITSPNEIIWFSSDGEHWQYQHIGDVFGETSYISDIAVSDTLAFAVLWDPNDNTSALYVGRLP